MSDMSDKDDTNSNDTNSGETPRLRALVGYLAGAFLGVILLVGAFSKVLDPVAFQETIKSEGLDFLLPAALVAMIGFAGAAVLYDTSNIMHHYPQDRYVAASMALFASIALMFWYILRLFMGRD